MNYTNANPDLIKPDTYDLATFGTDIKSVSTITAKGIPNVINKIQYAIWAEIDGQRTFHENEVIYSDEYLNAQESFTPYESLTKEQVVSWVEGHTHLQSIHYSLCNRFVQQPVEVKPALPWA